MGWGTTCHWLLAKLPSMLESSEAARKPLLCVLSIATCSSKGMLEDTKETQTTELNFYLSPIMLDLSKIC